MSEEVKQLEFRIEGLLADAIRHEEAAAEISIDGPDEGKGLRDRRWHQQQAARKFEQAEWVERRLSFMKMGL